MKKKLEQIFHSGHSITLQNVVKRIDGEWESRIVWKHTQLPYDDYIKDCRWEGFENIEECLDDCIKYLETLK